RRDAGRVEAEHGEVARELRGAVAAAELDDRDALAAPVEARREAVELRQLGRVEARALRLGLDAGVGPRLRPAVEAEHAVDDALELRGEAHGAAVGVEAAEPGVLEAPELDAERRVHGRRRAGEDDAAPYGARVEDLEVVCVGELLDARDVAQVG